MAVPKFRISKAKGRGRRSVNMRIVVPNLIACSNCGNRMQRHRLCSRCGYYRGEQIIDTEDIA